MRVVYLNGSNRRGNVIEPVPVTGRAHGDRTAGTRCRIARIGPWASANAGDPESCLCSLWCIRAPYGVLGIDRRVPFD